MWEMTRWRCVCGRYHAPWWRTVQAPSCTAKRPDQKAT
jgi:hypothetical protein